MEIAQEWINYGIELAKEFGPKLITAILIYVIGIWIIKRIIGTSKKVMSKSKYDESLQRFLLNLVSWALKIFLIIIVISRLGVDVTTFAAVIAAAGLAVGLALQGSLSNFAGGVLIMIFKPYRIGDLIEAQGVLGVVKEIEIFTTKLTTPENKLAIVPNGAMANGNIINYTAEGKIRVDTVIGVGYNEDIKKTQEVLMNVLTSNEKVLQDPAPSVNVMELADSSVNFAVRPFCKPEHYWDVYFAIYENCKLALDAANIEIMIPLALSKQELAILKKVIIEVAQQIEASENVKLTYIIGTMIELPRAALKAHEIAEEAEFFSFGTNDLTQTTLGMSRDDAGNFIGEYVRKAVLPYDPFVKLDTEGVGELIKIATERGRQTRNNIKLGICGEHGGDPLSIDFCYNLGLNYVSCSPFRVPIARLAAAQAAIRKKLAA